MAAVTLVGLAAFSLSAAADDDDDRGRNGTTLSSDITVTTERTRTYPWTLTKTASARSLDLFRGDSATVTYTVTATKGDGVERAYLKGTVTVTNGGAVATQDLTVIVQSSLTPRNAPVLASVTLDLGAKSQLQPGETATWPYRVEVPAAVIGETYKATAVITITNHSGSLGYAEGPSPAASAPMTAAIGDVNATVNVDDSFGPTFAFTASGTRTYARAFRCDEDRGDKVNTATIRETGLSASATVSVSCYSLSVSTGATTSFTRTWSWTIAKSASASALTLEPDGAETRPVEYEVLLASTSADSAWAVKGEILIANPAPMPAPLSAVTAALPAGAAAVSCPVAAAAANITTCSYERALPSGAATSVTATVTMANAPSGSTSYTASAPVDFASAAITKIDESVTVTDVLNGTSSTLGTATGGARYAYRQVVGPYSKCGPYTFANTASFLGTNGARGSASANVAVTVTCYDLTVEGSAATSLTRTWTWSIDKSASADSLTLEPGEAGSIGYGVTVSAQSADSQWAAAGRITVLNPSPVVASLASLSATAAGASATIAGCPNTVPARGSVECAWSASLASAAGGPLALGASLADSSAFNRASYSGSGTVDFAGATITKVDETVTVTDAFGSGAARELGAVTAPSGRFDYTQTVAATNKCGTTTVANVAAFRTATGRTGSDATQTTVNVKCYQLRVTGSSATSLTRTYSWRIAKSASAPSVVLSGVGATASLGYTVELSSSAADGAWRATGGLVVENPAPIGASLSALTASAGDGGVTISCPTTAIGARASLECSWTAPLSSAAAATLVATASLADDSAFTAPSYSGSAGIDFSAATVTEVDRTVTVTDTTAGTTRTLGQVSGSGRFDYEAQVGPYAKCGQYAVENTAALSGTLASGSSSVTTRVSVTCYDLGVTGSPSTSYTRTYTWSIAKTADRTALTLAKGATGTIGYTVTLAATSQTSGWSAAGGIVVANPAPTAALLASVNATSTSGSAAVFCPSLAVPSGGTLACSWTLAAASGATTTLAITATLADSSAFSASSYAGDATIDFSAASVTEVGRTATVTDTSPAGTTSLGTHTAGATSPITYSLTAGPYSACGGVNFDNTARFTSDTGSGSASANVSVTVECPPSPSPTATRTPKPTATPRPSATATPRPSATATPRPSATVTPRPSPTATPTPTPTATPPQPPVGTTNCTLTIGYWKNHASVTALYLPQRLGNDIVSGTSTAVNILKKEDSSNGLEKLKAQLLAAKLSIARGADPSEISSTVAQADTQIASYPVSRWNALPKSVQAAILAAATKLDQYNNGIIGPGHCP